MSVPFTGGAAWLVMQRMSMQRMSNPERLREMDLAEAQRRLAQLEQDDARLQHDYLKLGRRIRANEIERRALAAEIVNLNPGEDDDIKF